jgi:CheY-like chemotaxis protein
MEAKKNILVIDDSSLFLKLIRNFLSPVYQVITSNSASKAMSIINQVLPDLILLDIEMPHISGFEFLHDLKKNPKTMRIPVVIVSNHFEEEVVAHAERIGASGLVPKPVNKELLFEKINYALANPPKDFFGL